MRYVPVVLGLAVFPFFMLGLGQLGQYYLHLGIVILIYGVLLLGLDVVLRQMTRGQRLPRGRLGADELQHGLCSAIGDPAGSHRIGDRRGHHRGRAQRTGQALRLPLVR